MDQRVTCTTSIKLHHVHMCHELISNQPFLVVVYLTREASTLAMLGKIKEAARTRGIAGARHLANFVGD